MKQIHVICDRCKQQVRTGDEHTLEVYRSDDTAHNLYMDICPNCFEKLWEGFLGLGELKYER